jgi:hypothetical protein
MMVIHMDEAGLDALLILNWGIPGSMSKIAGAMHPKLFTSARTTYLIAAQHYDHCVV